MNTATRVQILDDAVCISHSANTLGKGMNPTILPQAVGNIVDQTWFFNLGMTTRLEKGKLWIQTGWTQELTQCHILPIAKELGKH